MLCRNNVIQLAKPLSGLGLSLEVAGCEGVYYEDDGNLQCVCFVSTSNLQYCRIITVEQRII